ncbi:hypothetical protein F5880DRAFT_1510934 [Lentinula raphanica]|nr:hypothetical protein F5880DRAFT_1510934 [Lentinula raphanica]
MSISSTAAPEPQPSAASVSMAPDSQDPWNHEIDAAIMQYLYEAKKNRNGTHDVFSAAVWSGLEAHIAASGYGAFLAAVMKDYFRSLKTRGYQLSKDGVVVPVTAPVTISGSASTTDAVSGSASATIPGSAPATVPGATPPTISGIASTAASPAAPATAHAIIPDRAHWNTEAEAILIEFLVEKKGEGLLSENNFKGKVYNLGAEHLRARCFNFSGKQVKARWTRFKAEFKIVAKLRTLSATDQVWDAYLAGHTKARPFRTHPFIHYDDIAAMIGHSTASGTFALSSENGVLAQHDSDSSSSSSEDNEEDGNAYAADSDKESPVKKRSSASTGITPARKRVRTSAGAQALTSMSATFAELTEGLKSGDFLAPPVTDTPKRKKMAFNIVRDEEELSPYSLAKARRVFRGSGELAREYLSFDSSNDNERRARTYWLMDEMNRD